MNHPTVRYPFLLAFTIFLVVVGAGCGRQESATTGAPTGTGPSSDALRLAVIPKSTGGEFWETVELGAREAAKDMGVEIKWEGTLTETEIAEQNKIIENMINLDVDGIALAPLNQQAQAKMVREAVNSGIPVVIFDSAVAGDRHISFVATNNATGGSLAGEHMVKLINGSGRVIVQRFVQGTASTEQRVKGFIETAERAGIEVLADPYPEDGTVAGAKKSAANTLERFVRNEKLELDGIFACNILSSLGTLAAIEDLRKSGVEVNAHFIGFDTSPKLVAAVQTGHCNALVVQSPKKMGYLAVKTLTQHLRGEKIEPMIDTGVELVTKERIDQEPLIRKLIGIDD